MGSSSFKRNGKKAIMKSDEKTKEIEELEEINIIVKKSQSCILEEQKKEEERKLEEKRKLEEEEIKRKEEEERKKEEFKQNALIKFKEEEIIIKIKITNEELTNYIIKFLEEFIQIYNSLQKKNTFISLIFEFNKKYIYSFNNKEYPDIPIKNDFFEILKYSTIIVVFLIFMSKDLDLYKKYSGKIKEPIEKFIYSIINIVGRNSLKTKVINSFIKNFKKTKRGQIFCINDVIKLLFSNGKYVNAYKNLKNALIQIINNLATESIEDVIIKINESILFFYNAGSYILPKNPISSTQTIKETATLNTKKNNKSKSMNKSKKTLKKKKLKKK